MSVELIVDVEFHFSELLNLKRADLIGKLLFSGKLCGTEGSNKVAGKVTRSVTSCVFLCMQLLKAIDLTAGALKDTTVSLYASIERYLQPMPRRNRSIIQFCKGSVISGRLQTPLRVMFLTYNTMILILNYSMILAI
jgi:hypothetical protein